MKRSLIAASVAFGLSGGMGSAVADETLVIGVPAWPSAQVTAHYTPETLIGKQVMAVVNFPPRQIGRFMSEVLVLGVPDAGGEVVLLTPDLDVPDGGRMY
ncbi:MAG: hypothetical protein ACPGID_02760 [Rubricella sp.]